MAEPQAAAPDAGGAPRTKGRRAALAVLLAAICLASSIASLAYLRWRPKKAPGTSGQPAAAAERKGATSPRERRDLGEFLVNLADPDGLAYLKATVVLEFEGADQKRKGGHGNAEESPEWDAPVRDAIVTTLSQCFRSELRTAQGKERLKRRLLTRINERTKGSGPHFVEVYFTSFAMQLAVSTRRRGNSLAATTAGVTEPGNGRRLSPACVMMERQTRTMETPGAPASAAASVDAVRPYDFRHPLRFSRDQVRAVALVHERYAGLLATTLSTHLRTPVEAKLTGVEQVAYEEFARSAHTSAILGLLSFAPADGNALLEIHPDVAEAILDRMLGGQGMPSGRLREPTAIEAGLIGRVVRLALSDLAQAWRGLADVAPALESITTSLPSHQVALPGDVVLVVGLRLHLCGVDGVVRLCLPAAAVGPYLAHLSASAWIPSPAPDGAPDAPKIGEHLGETTVGLRAVLGHATLPLGDLVTLEPGDVICLDTRPGQELLLYVEDEPKFLCHPGTLGKRNAVQITRLMQETPST